MSKEAFTNRHGVTTVVDEETGSTEVTPVVVPPKPKKTTKKKAKSAPKQQVVSEPVFVAPRPKKPFPWKLARTIAVVLVAGIVVFVFVTQANSSQYQSAREKMRNAVMKAKSEKLITNVDLATLVATLQKDFPSISCPKQSFSIQFTKEAKDAIKQCQDAQGSYDGIRQNLSELKQIASYGAEVTAAMKPALVNPSDGTFANISESTANWQAAADKVASITPPQRLKGSHTSVVQAAKNVAAAWQKLNEADAARDSAAYEAAKTELSNSYESFRGSSSNYLADSLPLQKQLFAQVNSFK